VLYDQVRCGKSTHLPDAAGEFWSPQLFKDELAELTRHVGIGRPYAVVRPVVGRHAALEHALDRPHRTTCHCRRPTRAASMPLWVEEAKPAPKGVAPDVQRR